jgi:uncharacterized oligopeptide transporter (OPT) family protein
VRRVAPAHERCDYIVRVTLSCVTYSAAGLLVDMSTVYRDAIFWIAVASCAVAQLFIIRAVIRTAIRPSAPSVLPAENPSPADDSRTNRSIPVPRHSVEIAWAILPIALIVAAFVGAWRLMHPGTP